MAFYTYKCVNKSCAENEKEVTVSKSMSEASNTEKCSSCGHDMNRVYTTFSANTADGFKQ